MVNRLFNIFLIYFCTLDIISTPYNTKHQVPVTSYSVIPYVCIHINLYGTYALHACVVLPSPVIIVYCSLPYVSYYKFDG